MSCIDEVLEKLGILWHDIAHWWQQNLVSVEPSDYNPVLDISGFLTILAFSVAVFALAGPKYQIRQSIAFFPVKSIFFWTLAISGAFMAFAELAIRYEWRIPNFISFDLINLAISGWISFIALYWMRICFIRPPKYTRWTSERFFNEAFRSIVNGTKEEILALARELMREMDRIVVCSPKLPRTRDKLDKHVAEWTALEFQTHNLFGLLEDARFCEVVARDLPSFPAVLVEKLVERKRFDTGAPIIIRRMVIALLTNKRSALFVENEWLATGYTGQTKPITRTIFFNWSKFERSGWPVRSPLDLSFPQAAAWDFESWRTYFSMARQYLDGLVNDKASLANASGVSEILKTMEVVYRQLGQSKHSLDFFDPYNSQRHADEANEFLSYLVEKADGSSERDHFDRSDRRGYGNDLSSRIARMYESSLSAVASFEVDDSFKVWDVQRNTFWRPLEEFDHKDSPTMRMVRRKLRRMIWDEIKEMDRFPNYKGAKYIRFCLFVFGLYDEKTFRKDALNRDIWPLAKVVTDWVRKNYNNLAASHPPLAEVMLPLGFSYDSKKGRILRQRENPLTGTFSSVSLELD